MHQRGEAFDTEDLEIQGSQLLIGGRIDYRVAISNQRLPESKTSGR